MVKFALPLRNTNDETPCVSRIGYAESDNLVDWTKNTKNIFPIEPKGIFYETASSNPRTWLSFRDPFRFEHKGEVYLLMDAKVSMVTGEAFGDSNCVRLSYATSDELLVEAFTRVKASLAKLH